MLSPTCCRSLLAIWSVTRTATRRWLPGLAVPALALISVSSAHAVDTANPTVTVTAPAVNSAHSSLSTISGTASDDSGLKRVDVYLYRGYTGVKQYFNFSTRAWGTALPASLPVTPNPATSGNPTSLNWSVDTSAPGFAWPNGTEMPPGQYVLEVRAVDTADKNSAYVRPAFRLTPLDTVAPTGAITTPADTVTAEAMPAGWSGTVQDEAGGSGVGYIRLSLFRQFGASLEYWNGTTWASGATYKNPALSAPDGNGVQSWSYSFGATGEWALPTDLPSGKYTLRVDAYDRHNNVRVITRTVNITPEDTTAPQIELAVPVPEAALATAPSSFSGTCWDPLENGTASGIAYAQLQLSRSWGGSAEYWNGTAWVTGVFSHPLTLGAPTTDGNGVEVHPWSFNGVPVSQLTQGKYTVRLFVRDRYNNLSSSTLRNFTITPTDSTAPVVTFTVPLDGSGHFSVPTIHGTVRESGSGLSRLEVQLSRWLSGQNQYWTGTAWSTVVTSFDAPIGTPDGNGDYSWDMGAAIPGGLPTGTNFPPGRYNAIVTAGDRYLNLSTATGISTFYLKPAGATGIDTAPPTVSLTSPTQGQTVGGLSALTGTAADTAAPTADQTGLSDVRVRLTRVLPAGNLHWTGTAWQSAVAYLNPRAATGAAVNWTRSELPSGADLPSGTYQVGVSATDAAVNASEETVVDFVVNNRPVAQAQSLGVARNLARALTLEASDADGDAIASWRIVTAPSHGTLSGTAPNLTYTPTNNYTGADSFSFAASDWQGEGTTATVDLVVSNDTVAPTVTFETPASNARLSAITEITGTVSDGATGSGIKTAWLEFQRPWTGFSNEFWNGSQWGASGHMPITLGPPNANGMRNWSAVTSQLPVGADFAGGRYLLRFVAQDNANLIGALNRIVWSGEDNTGPVLTVTSVANNDLLAELPGTVTGTVQDVVGPNGAPASGVARLWARWGRNWNGVTEYWNGTAWSTSTGNPFVVLPAPDGTGVIHWSLSPPLPVVEASARYQLTVQTFDRADNPRTVVVNVLITPEDTTAPTVAVTYPAAGANLSRLTKIAGTAGDAEPGSGPGRVDVRLRRNVGGQNQYWNGSAWTTGDSILASRTELSWLRDTNLPTGADLPVGTYTAQANAYDRAGNASTTVVRNFNIVANTPPSATAQSVTAVGHHGRPGTPKAITLSATDVEGDAVEDCDIVTQPQHGTLSGSGPNVTYTANADYFGPDSFSFAASDWGGVNGTTATVNIEVVAPAPIDVLIKNNADPDYLGDDIVNTDAANQTAEQALLAGETASYLIKVQKENLAQSIVLKVFGENGTTGWTVRYYDAHTNGLDITADVTSTNGWQNALTVNDVNIRLEVTAPANLTDEDELAIQIGTVSAAPDAATDVVKAVTMAQPNLQPDLTLQGDEYYPAPEPPDYNTEPVTYPLVGQSIFSEDASDQQAILPGTGGVRRLQLWIKNVGSMTASYRLSGIAAVGGWTAKYIDTATNQDVTAAIVAGTWEVSLAPDQTRQVRVETEATQTAAADEAVFPLTVRNGKTVNGQWQASDWVDSGSVVMRAQALERVEYSLDYGATWQTYSGALSVPRLTVVGFKAIPKYAGIPWRTSPSYQPVWSQEGQAPIGETVWLQFKTVGTQSLQGKCRNSITGNVTVTERVW